MNMSGYSYWRNKNDPRKEKKFISCSKARRGLGCHHVQWEYKDLESLILRFCKAVDLANVIGADSSDEQKLNAAVLDHERIKLEIEDVNGRNLSLLSALEQGEGTPPQIILSRIKENEAKLANLEETRKQAEDAILLLASSRVDASEQQNLIITLLEQLDSLEGEDLHLLRVRLSDAIKKVVKLITTYPGGRFFTDEEVESYRRDLIASDEYEPGSIAALCEKLDIKPNKSNRLLMMEFHNGEHRTVLASGKVLDRELPPPADWDINTLFESLAFSVFKKASGVKPVNGDR